VVVHHRMGKNPTPGGDRNQGYSGSTDDMLHEVHDMHRHRGTEKALDIIERELVSLIASQKSARFQAEEFWEAIEKQSLLLASQVTSMRKHQGDESEDLFVGAAVRGQLWARADSAGANTSAASFMEDAVSENANDATDVLRDEDERAGSSPSHRPGMQLPRSPSSVIAITEACEMDSNPDNLELTGGWRTRLSKIVGSPHFDLLVGVLIVANTLTMSLQLEYMGQKLEREYLTCATPPCQSTWSWPAVEMCLNVLEHIFTALFVLELVLRLAADGLGYLKSWANMSDAVIVLVSSVDSWVLTPLGKDGMENAAILRLVRLVRLSKVFRVVRVLKTFKSLRVLVSAMAASIGALAWSMTLLFILELMGAIFLAQVLRPFIEEPDRSLESRQWLWDRFGTWVRAMLTVFEITMAPGGFIQYRRVAEEVHPLFALFFVAYVCVVTFAMVRVITAMFLKATLSASDQDEASLATDRANAREAYAQRLRSALQEDPVEDSIGQEDLRKLLSMNRMKEWLEEVGLTQPEAERLFLALEHGHGAGSFSEFVAALQRMRGPPRAADSIVCLYESRWILKRLSYIEEVLKWSPRKVSDAESKELLASVATAVAMQASEESDNGSETQNETRLRL